MDEFMKNVGRLSGSGRIERPKAAQGVRESANPSHSARTKSFGEVLESVKFSKHATERIASRDIRLSDADVDRLRRGIGMAREKGIRQTLIMMDNKVFIASVQNNTIITASSEENLREHIFTNIDGAVIV